MPTGYTDKIKDGLSFEQFAMSCARAFIRNRDDNDQIPETVKPSKYHAENIPKAEEALDNITKMTLREARVSAHTQYKEELARNKKYATEQQDLLGKYTAMLQQVRGWQPPTPEHEEIKKFMIEQIESSIKFDCGYTFPPPTLLTGEEYINQKTELYDKEYNRSVNDYQKDVKHAQQATQWIQALRDSLKVQPKEGDKIA